MSVWLLLAVVGRGSPNPWVKVVVGVDWRWSGGRLWLTVVGSEQRGVDGIGGRPRIMHNGRLLLTLVFGRLGGCWRSASVGTCDILLASRIWLWMLVRFKEYSDLAEGGVPAS